jgi:ketosteroid isomerase-like protein
VSKNLDLVRSICKPWARGDFSSVAWAHPEIEFVIADGPTPGSWSGLAGMAQGYREFLSAWDFVRTDVEAYREVDSERVLLFTHTSGRGKTSGLELGPISARSAVLFHFRGGTVVRVVAYWERNHALADLGLAQEADTANQLD